MQLIVLMSLSDCINGIVALFFTNILLWQVYDSHCALIRTIQFMHYISLGFSYGAVVLIAIDRYLHVKYLQRYPIILTKRRGRIIVLAVFVYNFLVAFTSSMPFLKSYNTLGKVVQICGGTIGVISVFILYYKTTKTVKIRVSSMHNCILESRMAHCKAIVNVALSISICTGLLFTPYIISVIIMKVNNSYQASNTSELEIFTWFTAVGLPANGICSCVIFILQNKPVKRLIKGIMVRDQS